MTELDESLSREPAVKVSSNRTFGLVFTAFWTIVALLPYLRGRQIRWWAVPLTILFCAAALTAPGLLGPLNRAWTLLGIALHKITNPIILGVCFYGVFTPVAFVLRLMGKDFLRLKPAPEADSYWIVRQPPGPEPQSMSNQF